MPKAAMLTFHGSHNFGSVFQAYALKQKIQQLGFTCDIINFRPAAQIDKYSLMPRLYGKKMMIKTLLQLPRFRALKESHRKYEDFIRTRLTAEKAFSALEDFQSLKDYDIYITGSDQVWGYSVPEFAKSETDIRPAYYWSFAEGKKISYASSTGEATFEQLLPYADLLKRFSAISVREERSLDIVRRLTGLNAVQCLDPTFLISKSEYLELAESSLEVGFPSEYVLLYSLQGMKIHRDWISFANGVSDRLGMPVLSVSPFCPRKSRLITPVYNAGPMDILNLFANASYVLTDTFHGTLFSIHFEKPFITFEPGRDDPRMNGILNLFGIPERTVHDVESGWKAIASGIDYGKVGMIREEEVAKSIHYLASALGVSE